MNAAILCAACVFGDVYLMVHGQSDNSWLDVGAFVSFIVAIL